MLLAITPGCEIILLSTVNICYDYWLNKKDDWPIAKQNNPRQKRSQSENYGIKKEQSQSCQADTQKAGHAQNEQAMSHVITHR